MAAPQQTGIPVTTCFAFAKSEPPQAGVPAPLATPCQNTTTLHGKSAFWLISGSSATKALQPRRRMLVDLQMRWSASSCV
jgi:hypothetical protein